MNTLWPSAMPFANGRVRFHCPAIQLEFLENDPSGKSKRVVQDGAEVVFMSDEDDRDTKDIALLKIARSPLSYLSLGHSGLSYGARIQMTGFPMRSHRSPDRLQQKAYSNADGAIRVSFGKSVDLRLSGQDLSSESTASLENHFYSDIDVVAG